MAKSRSTPLNLYITRIYIENWRNFSFVDLPLQRRAFFVGPNASGKSNLLDAFRFLRDIVSEGGGLQEAIRKRFGVSNLRCFAARRYSTITVKVHIGNDENSEIWIYKISFKQNKQRVPYINEESVWNEGKCILARPNNEDLGDPKRLTQTFLEQLQVNKDFRQVAEFFSTIDYLHIVPQLIREPTRLIGFEQDPYGSDFLEQIAKTNEKTKKAWLKRIQDALTVAVPQLQEIKMGRDERGAPHLWCKYKHWRAHGKWQREEQLSDGTLRLLGLLWITLSGKGPLLLEEPELNLHPEVVRYLPRMFSRMQIRTKRQVLISTHAPDMLQDEGIGLDETILLQPEQKGTKVFTAAHYEDVQTLLDSGIPLPEAVDPYTKPNEAHQLSQFGEQ